MADDNFVELLRATVNTLEDLLGGNEPNTQIYSEQCKAMVHGFVQVRNSLPTLLEGAGGVCSAQIFKEIYCLACGAVRILELCCEQTWLQAVIRLQVHTRNGPQWTTFETLRDELDWCINILRGNIDASTSTGIHVNRLIHRDREGYDEENLRRKLRHAVESGNLNSQEVAIANFLLPRLDVRSNGQPVDPHCRCIQKLNCWKTHYQETVPLIHLIEGPVEGTRVGFRDGRFSSLSPNLTWFGIRVAKKTFRNVDGIREIWEKEAHIMATLTHPNVVSFIGCSDGEGGPAIIMESEDQSLLHYITNDLQQRNSGDVQTSAEMRLRATPFPELVVAVDLLTQIASGMAYLHSQDVAHLDLKLANLLIKSHTQHGFLHVKIADFGESIQLKGRSGKIRNRWRANLGTTIYRAPELFHGDNWVCFKSADVCSFGFTAWAILHCHEPRLENVLQGEPHYYNALVAGRRLGFDESIPDELQDLVKLCWHTNPDVRPPFSEIYWFLQSFKAKLLGSHVPLVQLQQRTARPRSGIRLWPGMLCLGSRQGQLDEQHEESV